MLYFSFVQAHLDYGLLVYGGRNKCVTNPIRKNLKKAIRRMLFRKFNDPTEPLFKELNILDFDSQHNLIIKFMWQVNNNEVPRNISQLFHVKNRIIGLENNIKYHIISVNLNIVKNSVFFQGPKLWNEISIDIRNKKSLVSLKLCTVNIFFYIKIAFESPNERNIIFSLYEFSKENFVYINKIIDFNNIITMIIYFCNGLYFLTDFC